MLKTITFSVIVFKIRLLSLKVLKKNRHYFIRDYKPLPQTEGLKTHTEARRLLIKLYN